MESWVFGKLLHEYASIYEKYFVFFSLQYTVYIYL